MLSNSTESAPRGRGEATIHHRQRCYGCRIPGDGRLAVPVSALKYLVIPEPSLYTSCSLSLEAKSEGPGGGGVAVCSRDSVENDGHVAARTQNPGATWMPPGLPAIMIRPLLSALVQSVPSPAPCPRCHCHERAESVRVSAQTLACGGHSKGICGINDQVCA